MAEGKKKRKKNRKGSLMKGFVSGLVLGLILPAVAAGVATKNPLSLVELVTSRDSGDDTVIEEKKVPYTLNARFSQAVLAEAKRDKDLIVYTQKAAVPVEASKAGLFGWDVYKQSKYLLFHGVARYFINFAEISDEDIAVDENTKTIDIYIPEPELSVEFLPEETEFLNTSNGILRFGEMQITPEMMTELESKGKEKIRQSVEGDPSLIETAETYAKLSVKEIIEPLLKKQINADAQNLSENSESPQYYSINVVIKDTAETEMDTETELHE